ncbi:hypothetical protein MKEN_00132800 [Mycena kentingensis (nom. inval.)]|nr:hypothetical protein MKEN_00132800 [Mycena kentingensis (nom. inval.)]
MAPENISSPVIEELGVFPWNASVTNFERRVFEVEKRKIVRPSQRAWGIFYNEETGAAHYYPPTRDRDGPRRPSVAVPAGRVYTQPAFQTVHKPDTMGWGMNLAGRCAMDIPLYPPMALMPRICIQNSDDDSDDENVDAEEINNAIVALERKFPADGLHFLRVGTNAEDLQHRTKCPKLLLDTGSSITWLYSSTARIIGTNDPLPREPADRSYSGGGQSVTRKTKTAGYADGFKVELDVHQGTVYVIQSWNRTLARYDALRLDRFAYCLAVAASPDKEQIQYAAPPRERMDGILGAASGHIYSFPYRQPDLFIPNYCQSNFCLSSGSRSNRSRFTIALGTADQPSFVLFGNGDKCTRFQRTEWSDWMPSALTQFWALSLERAVVGSEEVLFRQPVPLVLDTGAATSIFPDRLDSVLANVMKAGINSYGSRYTMANLPQLKTTPVEFHFANNFTIRLPSLEYLTDNRGAKPETTFCAFFPGSSLLSLGGHGIIMASAAGLVIEFEYPTDPAQPGRLRVAFRLDN